MVHKLTISLTKYDRSVFVSVAIINDVPCLFIAVMRMRRNVKGRSPLTRLPTFTPNDAPIQRTQPQHGTLQ